VLAHSRSEDTAHARYQ